MFSNKKLAILAVLVMVAPLVLAACGPTPAPSTVVQTVVVEQTKVVPGETVVQTVEVEKTVVQTQVVEVTPTPVPVTRKGAWVDQLVFTEQNDAQAAVKQLQANDIDIYAYTVSDPAVYEAVKGDPNLASTPSLGAYTEITANPVPVFNDGRINPFGVAKFREAMNWLIDRNYLVQEILGGLGMPKYTTLNSAFPDYARYVDVCRELEAKYAYNPDKAKEVITQVMTEMGATLGADGKWQYNGAPVTLIGIIRTEDERKEYGDYIASQLESVGFTVDRQYKTRTEASPIWIQSDPAEGQWNFYTGGWITTAVSRDDATNFGFFYTKRGSAAPLWQAYTPSAEFDDVAGKLYINDFKNMEERAELFKKALRLSMEDSVRIWLVDNTSFAPQRADIEVAYDLAGGVAGSSLMPYTIRFKDKEGGTMRIAQPGVLVEPWNPIAGSNWIYDQTPIRATADQGVIADPYTGLYWPLRIEKAECVVKEGLPVAKTLDWIDLSFAPKIEVPADAWADWDATTQTFIKAGDMPTPTLETNTKCTVTYPKDLWTTVKWHDGSPITMADFIMRIIMTFDPGKPESAIYDPAFADQITNVFLSHFRGVVIESTDPLVITTYDDTYYLDAEWLPTAWFPYYFYGPGAWHNLAIGIMADAHGKLAFSTDKAGEKGVEWMSYIAGPSLEILKGELDALSASGGIVYTPTLSLYLTPEEIAARYANLTKWYKLQGHFWLGTGPFWLDKAFPVEKTLSLRRFEDYPDLANRWSGFGAPKIPEIEVTGPAQVKIGEEAKFEVAVTFEGEPYPSQEIASAKYLVFDATGALAGQGEVTLIEEGKYGVTLPADVTGKLQAGSNKLEVVLVSSVVSIPGIVDYEFVVTQ